MYVCLCEAVTDRTIRKAIARGATTTDAVRRACGAGRGCGGCLEAVRVLLAAAGVDPAATDRYAAAAPGA